LTPAFGDSSVRALAPGNLSHAAELTRCQLVAAVKASGIRRAELARLLGVSKPYVSNLC
jgi:hypothetical protein